MSHVRGYVCDPPELEGVFSGWSEHGMCEMWEEVLTPYYENPISVRDITFDEILADADMEFRIAPARPSIRPKKRKVKETLPEDPETMEV